MHIFRIFVKKQTYIYAIVVFSCSIFLLFGNPNTAYAQYRITTGFSFGIYPPMTHVIIAPSRATKLSFTTINTGDPILVSEMIVPFVAEDDLGGVKLIDCKKVEIKTCDAISWFSLKEPSFFIKNGETHKVTIDLFVPSTAQTGDYSVSLLFTKIPQPVNAPISSQIVPAVGTNIILTVTSDGKLEKKGKVVSFSALGGITAKLGSLSIHLYDSFDKIPVILQMVNTGDTVIEPSGELTIQSSWSPDIHMVIPQQFILSHTLRTLLVRNQTDSSNKRLAETDPWKQSHSVLLPRSIYVGKYNIQTTLSLDPNAPVTQLSTSFWAFPYKLLTLLFLVFVSWYGMKKRVFNFQTIFSSLMERIRKSKDQR